MWPLSTNLFFLLHNFIRFFFSLPYWKLSLKGITWRLLPGVPESLASLLLCSGAITRKNEGSLNTCTEAQVSVMTRIATKWRKEGSAPARISWTKGHRGGSRPWAAQQVAHHHVTPNSSQFETYELLISGIFHVIFLDRGWPSVTETPKSETVAIGGLL